MDESILEEIFENYRNIYKDISVVQTGSCPESLDEAILQDGILEAYSKYLDEVVNGHETSNILIHGGCGLGKTMVTHMLLSKYKRETTDTGTKFEYIFVSCDSNNDIENVKEIIRHLEHKLGIEKPFRQSKDISKNINRIAELVHKISSPVVIILDAIEIKKSMSLIKMLSNINDIEPDAESISLICIASEPKVKDEAQLNNLFNREIEFTPYTSPQIAAILTKIVDKAYIDGFVDETVIPACVTHSIQELDSDMRRTISLLEKACTEANNKNAEKATDIHVRKVIDAENNRTRERIQSLTIHEKMILLAMIKRKNKSQKYVSALSLFPTYKQLATFLNEDNLNYTSLENIFSTLEGIGILAKRRKKIDGNKFILTYAPKMPASELIDFIYQDSSMASLKDFKIE